MKSINDELPLFRLILDLIANQFGDKCEVVLHDLTKDYSSTIVDIRNGHLTGRSINGCGSNMGLEVLRGTVTENARYNYITTVSNGHMLRSSSIYIKDDDGKIIGSICINYDISETLQFENFLRQFNHFEPVQEEDEDQEVFSHDVTSLLQHLLQKAQSKIGKEPSEMDKEERRAFIRYLDKKGAFLITKSSEQVCELLGISKFTFYNDLELVRAATGE
ncbi:transcriptional regulator [Clostridium sp. MCC353]|uniref:helix-turn-helix transcriptional regulator n=1 Tax=Clostridium sp. MCC353 TaxID=2592646 RepID=UPI001C02B2D3|nr:helix-turn-helix transcriptional regulator [Clostridium sp. MCC353]MBS6646889.1 transcriptional regulator [Clostridiaceae bacterium]MBT9779187.1 transcriptional regulator [Clostridium sp. MCC353]